MKRPAARRPAASCCASTSTSPEHYERRETTITDKITDDWNARIAALAAANPLDQRESMPGPGERMIAE